MAIRETKATNGTEKQPMKITVYDRISFKITSREMTDEGFLRVPGYAARTGIQEYLASELKITDGDPDRVVNVYRPPEEVFNYESLASYEGKDATNDHPSEMVSSVNYKELTVGHVAGPGVRDGDFVKVNLIVKDQETIDDINEGKVELSAGYSAVYDYEPGVAPCGTQYEYVQRKIVINHVALVDTARSGKQARIFDNRKGVKSMPKFVTLDNGRSVEVADNSTAGLIEDSIARVTKQYEDEKQAHKDTKTKLAKAEATVDSQAGEIEELKVKTTDQSIDKRVNERVKLLDSAKKLIKDFDGTGKTADEIKLECVKSVKKNIDFKDRDAAYIDAMFDLCVDQAMEKESEDQEEEGNKDRGEEERANDSLKNFANDVQNLNNNKKTEFKDRSQSDFDMSQSWKKTAGLVK